jgi:hypothetical protein
MIHDTEQSQARLPIWVSTSACPYIGEVGSQSACRVAEQANEGTSNQSGKGNRVTKPTFLQRPVLPTMIIQN